MKPASSTDSVPLARMTGITKRFGRVTVLEDVDFEVRAGEVHILAGENGAGKSTLIKILAGVHTDFEGTLEIDGKSVRPANPLEAVELGVSVIHQELSLIPPMSVADNVFLGRMQTFPLGMVNDWAQREETRKILRQFKLDLDADQRVETLSVAQQQLVEIAKALSLNARVIVMDEPTSALNAPEVRKLFGLIDRLKSQGCGIVYITHKMEEVEQIADHITVLRDGRLVGSAPAEQLPVPELIRWMVGREVEQLYPRHEQHDGELRLCVQHFCVERRGRRVVDDVSLDVRAGEIVGVAGLQGSGNSDLLMGLFGALGRNRSGSVMLDGRQLKVNSPRQSIRNGMALLTSDRKANGLVLSMSVVANTTLARLEHFSPAGWRLGGAEHAAAAELASALHLRAASLDMEVGFLSGGNQQKVALAKWVLTQPKVLLLDEPTRGVDIGAKREIYELMDQWTAQGIAILLVTSEMPELLAMSDRMIVMHRGRVTAQYRRGEATPEKVLEAAMGRETEESRS